MKQQLLILTIAFFVGLCTSHGQEHLSHTIFEAYDTDTDSYSEAMKQEFTYNTNGQLTMITYSIKDGTNWIETLRNEFKYNASGNLIEESYATKMSPSSAWINQKKNVTVYTGNRVTSEENFEWENGEWKPDEKTILNYVGNRIETFDVFEWENMQWEDDSRGVITYSGNKIASVTTEEFKNGVWTLDDRDVYTRSATTRIKDYINQDWNGAEWENDEKISYTDDTKGNRLTEIKSESDDGITWELEDKIEYTYDNTALMSNYYNPFSVDSFSISWGLADAPHYNKVLSNIEYSYDDSRWELSGRTTYYYSDDTMGLNDLSNSNFVTVYPNPVKNTLNIKLKNHIQADASLFDINGRLVLDQKIHSLSTSLNIEALNSGIYILKIRAENGFATKRITKN